MIVPDEPDPLSQNGEDGVVSLVSERKQVRSGPKRFHWEYKCHWKGGEEPTWEPRKNLVDTDGMINAALLAFENSLKQNTPKKDAVAADGSADMKKKG